MCLLRIFNNLTIPAAKLIGSSTYRKNRGFLQVSTPPLRKIY